MHLLLPRTDEGAAVQAVMVFVAVIGMLIVTRRDRDLRLFVCGVGVLAVAWFGLRAVH